MEGKAMPVLVISGAEKLQGKLDESISPLGKTWGLQKPFSVSGLKKSVEEALEASRS
jgi:hypothetical protein